jgi:hypothetical protein
VAAGPETRHRRSRLMTRYYRRHCASSSLRIAGLEE